MFNGDFKQAVDIARPVLDTSLTWKGLFGHVGSVIPCPSTAALIVGDADVMLGDYDAANTALGAAVPVAKTGNVNVDRFLALWTDIHKLSNGYFVGRIAEHRDLATGENF